MSMSLLAGHLIPSYSPVLSSQRRAITNNFHAQTVRRQLQQQPGLVRTVKLKRADVSRNVQPQMTFGGLFKKVTSMAKRDIDVGDISKISGHELVPSEADLQLLLQNCLTPEENSLIELKEQGQGPADHLASKRFSSDEDKISVELYRDTAGWCPYSQKVWLMLEEKKQPYSVSKVAMNCYGEKPQSFWQMQPSGGIPVAVIDGRVIRESNDILEAIEQKFPSPSMFPEDQGKRQALPQMLRLERAIFGCWFRWCGTGERGDASFRDEFRRLAAEVDDTLGVFSDGPFFLGGERPSIVDVMFCPFLERMAASLPYYKGFLFRGSPDYPNINAWFAAMEALDSFKGIQSDYYTTCMDLPPQIGGCTFTPESTATGYKGMIDGSDGTSWRLPLSPEGSAVEPVSDFWQNKGMQQARREAARRLLGNLSAVTKFCCRAVGDKGRRYGSQLANPDAVPNEEAEPVVRLALQVVMGQLLREDDWDKDTIAAAIKNIAQIGLPKEITADCLIYLRERISVPRDMPYPAARQLRAHLNLVIDALQ
ncbi:hypothetical protein CYMTET_39985 [Cymbomonas tetramitiformis]|uniref:Glutathione S-transferase n=1 Tax=Cymbomonas tetramitiformis TaxID=36881 RepID=A0AAE0CAQ8_9CHLO|nr:hypothetical protein CYMTET_39985 [Cymbomonas tetramitiformis]